MIQIKNACQNEDCTIINQYNEMGGLGFPFDATVSVASGHKGRSLNIRKNFSRLEPHLPPSSARLSVKLIYNAPRSGLIIVTHFYKAVNNSENLFLYSRGCEIIIIKKIFSCRIAA